VEFEGLMAIAEALRNGSPAMANRALPGPLNYAQIPELADRGRARVQAFLATLNEQLAAHAFVAGSAFSIADITAVVAVDFARVVKVKPGEDQPHVLRWRERMALRKSMAL
jgi:glutathione S-transferase